MTLVKDFKPKEHYEMVSAWWVDHKMPVVPLNHLPNTGKIVSVDGEYIAAGWLYCTNSAVCLLEAYISSPTSQKAQRLVALDALTESLLQDARSRGFESVVAVAKNSSIKARCERTGFKETGTFTLFSKGI